MIMQPGFARRQRNAERRPPRQSILSIRRLGFGSLRNGSRWLPQLMLGVTKSASVGGLLFVHFWSGEDFDMKAFIATCIAAGVLWALDVEMNGGRYSDVVKKAVVSVLPR
jgi:hypothetical protein